MPNRRNFLRRGMICTSALAASTPVARPADPPQPAGTGYDYPLPKLAPGSRLLFIGDSITDMKWGRNEKDRNHYLGHSYVYLIASRLGVDMPQAQLEFFNRGHSGNRIADLKARWQEDVIDLKPDLLSILVGVNDRKTEAGETFDDEKWEADYREVLSRSRASNAALRVVLLDPFVLQSGWALTEGGQWAHIRKQIDQMRAIVATLATEFDAVHVPTQEVFDAAARTVSPEHWIWDGVHPLPQGHELIARRWIEEVSARW